MLNVYCIPGLGVNERLFKNLKLNNCTIYHIKWEIPLKNESLAHYAMRLAKQIDSSKPFILIGVSFGGMCSVEISKKLNPLKTFIVSSAKGINEIPLKMKMWKYLPLHKYLSDNFYKKSAMLVKKQFGVSNGEQQRKFLEMLNTAPKNYFAATVNSIVSWNNKSHSENIIHIHGTSDKILPLKNGIKYDYLIKGGTHFMIVNKADEINSIINEEVKKLHY